VTLSSNPSTTITKKKSKNRREEGKRGKKGGEDRMTKRQEDLIYKHVNTMLWGECVCV
jgi:hypothetical protein